MATVLTPDSVYNLTGRDLIAGAVYEHKTHGYIMACNKGDEKRATFAVRLCNGQRVDLTNLKKYRKIPTVTLES